MNEQILKIEGMTCGHCTRAVEMALKSVPRVTEVKVELSEGTATVEGNANLDALIQAVSEAGYEAKLMEAH
jgi:copper chaperone